MKLAQTARFKARQFSTTILDESALDSNAKNALRWPKHE